MLPTCGKISIWPDPDSVNLLGQILLCCFKAATQIGSGKHWLLEPQLTQLFLICCFQLGWPEPVQAASCALHVARSSLGSSMPRDMSCSSMSPRKRLSAIFASKSSGMPYIGMSTGPRCMASLTK